MAAPKLAIDITYLQVENPIRSRGEVFTKPEVVDFMLNIGGYTTDKPLYHYKVLEPSCGKGDFIAPIVQRLMDCYTSQIGLSPHLVNDLGDAIFAVELDQTNAAYTKKRIKGILSQYNVSTENITVLLEKWIVCHDFLLVGIDPGFTHVFGNPPYVRHESIAPQSLVRYKEAYTTIADRADLYVPFIERSLNLLANGGLLTFICADRWIKNKYGAKLRALIDQKYHLDTYVNFSDTPAFENNVDAYPAIFLIRNQRQATTRIVNDSPKIEDLNHLQSILNDPIATGLTVQESTNVVNGSAPWIINSKKSSDILADIEARFPTITEAGCNISIGVATGADKVYIGQQSAIDIEVDRLIPIVKTKDIASGKVEWGGNVLINPYHQDGSLVSLESYPKLAAYLDGHQDVIRNRHCAKNNPQKWYKTLDRVYPALQNQPKLLIPDIKQELFTVLDEGNFYPHHNLYYITAADWDLRALKMVLGSDIAKLFLNSYALKMRGGYLRMQAQYLRRLRLPKWSDVDKEIQKSLIMAFLASDIDLGNSLTNEMYEL